MDWDSLWKRRAVIKFGAILNFSAKRCFYEKITGVSNLKY